MNQLSVFLEAHIKLSVWFNLLYNFIVYAHNKYTHMVHNLASNLFDYSIYKIIKTPPKLFHFLQALVLSNTSLHLTIILKPFTTHSWLFYKKITECNHAHFPSLKLSPDLWLLTLCCTSFQLASLSFFWPLWAALQTTRRTEAEGGCRAEISWRLSQQFV